jgi:hypothetical protein
VPRSLAIGTAIIATLSLPVVVFAADSKVDPQASSPAGAVYEIPLQTARDFGSPGGGAHAGGGSGGGGVLPKGSAIKSENGYGSSSQVPGLSASTAKAETAKVRSGGGSSTGKRASGGSSASGSGSGGSATGTQGDTSDSTGAHAPQAPTISARNASSDAPSLTGTYGLVLLIALGGAAAGIAASLAARGSFGRQGS